MARALVHLGPARIFVSKLSRCEQLFLARWLQLLHDEVHPRWSIRPLSLSNLSSLYPQTLNWRNKQLVFVTEDELLRRIIGAEPDAAAVNHLNQHSADEFNRVQCSTCVGILDTARSNSLAKLAELVEQLISSIDAGDESSVLLLTSIVASEAVGAKVPLRFMMQTCRGYVLKDEIGSFSERLYGFLRHDVAQQPREHPMPPRKKCSVRRAIQMQASAVKRLPSRIGMESLGWLWVDRQSAASANVWFGREIEDRLNRREDAAAALRSLTPGWLALLRFCFPDVTVRADSRFEVRPSGQAIESPGHRRTFSRAQVERAFPALETLIENDDVRASLYWLSLAYQVWDESVAHAAGMIWMSLEALSGNAGLNGCADAYVDRLQSQLADDIEETLATLAADAASQKKGQLPAQWVKKLPKRHYAGSDERWLAELDMAAQRVCNDPAICFVIRDAASIAYPPTREAVLAQTQIDLRFLRATRHAVAHKGKSAAEEPLLHYLATLGCECIRALLARRLDCSPHEGTLEGRPILQAECEEVKAHSHRFYIPTWITENSETTYMSTFAFAETIRDRITTIDSWHRSTESAGHRHTVTLTQENRIKLAAGEYVNVISSTTEEHSHKVQLYLI